MDEKPEVKVAVTSLSLGVKYVGLVTPEPAKVHGSEVRHRVYDVRGVLDDPVGVLPARPGTDSDIKEAILNTPGVDVWLKETEDEVYAEIVEASQTGRIVFYILILQCAGSFQRSVVLLDELVRRLSERCGPEVVIYQPVHATATAAFRNKQILGVT